MKRLHRSLPQTRIRRRRRIFSLLYRSVELLLTHLHRLPGQNRLIVRYLFVFLLIRSVLFVALALAVFIPKVGCTVNCPTAFSSVVSKEHDR